MAGLQAGCVRSESDNICFQLGLQKVCGGVRRKNWGKELIFGKSNVVSQRLESSVMQ